MGASIYLTLKTKPILYFSYMNAHMKANMKTMQGIHVNYARHPISEISRSTRPVKSSALGVYFARTNLQ